MHVYNLSRLQGRICDIFGMWLKNFKEQNLLEILWLKSVRFRNFMVSLKSDSLPINMLSQKM